MALFFLTATMCLIVRSFSGCSTKLLLRQNEAKLKGLHLETGLPWYFPCRVLGSGSWTYSKEYGAIHGGVST